MCTSHDARVCVARDRLVLPENNLTPKSVSCFFRLINSSIAIKLVSFAAMQCFEHFSSLFELLGNDILRLVYVCYLLTFRYHCLFVNETWKFIVTSEMLFCLMKLAILYLCRVWCLIFHTTGSVIEYEILVDKRQRTNSPETRQA